MTDEPPDWIKAQEVDPEFAGAAFNPGYNQRRAACLARHDHALLEVFYASRRRKLSGRSQIIEFGCELTGGSFWLAESGRLAVVDIAPDPLQACAERSQQHGLGNVLLLLLRQGKDLDALAPCDLFYSALSLKRVPPTTLIQILSLFLSKVTTGGVALVHAPTRHRHDGLMVENNKDHSDLHLIPQWVLSQTFKQLGFEVVLIQENACYRASDIIYHTFLAERLSSFPVDAPDPA